MPSRRPRRPPTRPSSRRQASTRRSTTDPTCLLDRDESRYLASRTMSVAEVAARENSTVAAVQASIDRVRIQREQFSQESLEHTIRRGAILAHSAAQSAILSALGATTTQVRQVGTDDAGTPITDIFTFPDHKTRLAALDRLTSLITSIQQQSPLVNINQNTLNQSLHLTPGQVSIESIIREVRLEKGLTQPIETRLLDAEAGEEVLPDRTDFELEKELAAARTAGLVVNEDDAEIVDAEEDEASEE